MTRSVRYVQVGRVVHITHGAFAGKLAVIVDIIDHNRALLDGPTTGVSRIPCSFKCLNLTTQYIRKVPRGASTQMMRKILAKNDIKARWEETAAAQRIAKREKRQALTDFERFKVYKLKKEARRERRKIRKTLSK